MRPPISQPAMTHGYFTCSPKTQRQEIAAKAIVGQKCTSNIPKQKPNTGSSNKAKKQMRAALDDGQSVPYQKKSGRGWTNKAQVQDDIVPTNDTNAPSHLNSSIGSKESRAQVGWSIYTQSSSVAQEAAG